MATIYTVKKGDTLSEIAEKYYKTYGYSHWQTYMARLILINGISNSDYIVIGQKIKLDGSVTKPHNSKVYKVDIQDFGIISTSSDERTVYARWIFAHSTYTEKYTVHVEYTTGSSGWFTGTTEDTKNRWFIYTPPANAMAVRIRVLPVARTQKINGKSTSIFVGQWCLSERYEYSKNPPGKPTGFQAEIRDGTKLFVSYNNIPDSLNARDITFHCLRIEDNYIYSGNRILIKNSSVSWSVDLARGYTYKVRAFAYNRDNIRGEWSDYTDILIVAPDFVNADSVRCTATSPTSILVSWNASPGAESYEIDYTTDKSYFEGDISSSEITKIQDVKTTKYEVTKLESGTEYFFRVRCKNAKGSSAWSNTVSVTVGSTPTRPTTWSSSSTAIVGESLNLYWVHNSSDNSAQKKADVEITIGDQSTTYVITADPDKEGSVDEIHTFAVDTSEYAEGTSFTWRVRTSGVTNTYSEWSVERTIDIYAQPTVTIGLANEEGGNDLNWLVQSFPLYISALASPNTQRPIGYHISIQYTPSDEESGQGYETVDQTGSVKIIKPGDEIYSKHIDVSESTGRVIAELSAGDIDLENDRSYTITCTAAMNSGLTAESTYEFVVRWADVEYIPNAEIMFNESSFSVNINPFCNGHQRQYFTVTHDTENDIYNVDESSQLESQSDTVRLGQLLDDIYTETWEEVYLYDNGTTQVYFCERLAEEETLVEDVTLSVYRREYDGSFTAIQKNIPNTGSTWVVDPHPPLDYARYRIVATSISTGAVSYCDLPGYPIGCTSVIIQWDESWSDFDTTNADPLTEPEWTGSLLILPYNISVSNKHSADVSLVKYIGRKHPVSYYGTQLGETASWSVEIPKSDTETLYGLRRLAIWPGDVYVREPSGSGYWAHVAVSFNQKHKEVAIPVTFEITRVEGGV